MNIETIMETLNNWGAATGISLAVVTPTALGILSKFKKSANKELAAVKSELAAEKMLNSQKEQMQLKLRLSSLEREKQLKELSLQNPYIDDDKRQLLNSMIYEIDAEIMIIKAALTEQPTIIDNAKQKATTIVESVVTNTVNEW